MKKRRLTDLYVVGKEFSIDDGSGDPITVYLRKLNPVEQEDAMRRSNALRAAVFAQAKDAASLVHATLQLFLDDLKTKDDFVELLVTEKVAERSQAVEAEVGDEEKWSKDDYLQGLKDAWATEMMRRYMENNEDGEAKAVFDAIQEYTEEVAKAMDHVDEEVRADYNGRSEEELRDMAYENQLRYEANLAWVKEYRRCEIWMSVRESKESKDRYFETREEVDELDQRVFVELMSEYRSMTVEPIEGKSLPVIPASSTQSESPEPQATEPTSGLQAVSV